VRISFTKFARVVRLATFMRPDMIASSKFTLPDMIASSKFMRSEWIALPKFVERWKTCAAVGDRVVRALDKLGGRDEGALSLRLSVSLSSNAC
jgi:hypothetical protein